MRGQIYAGHERAAAREPRRVVADAATDVENRPPRMAAEVDDSRQVVQLLEAVFFDLPEELSRAGLALRDFPIVDVIVPIVAYRTQLELGGHGAHVGVIP